MGSLKDVCTYINDLLVIGKSTFNKLLTTFNAVFKGLNNAGLKVNAKKC